MKTRACRHAGFTAVVAVAVWTAAGTGCVASKYKLASTLDRATPPPALELTAATPFVSATLHHVLVFHGPGSWKRDAYWDEYVVTLAAPGPQPLVLEGATLVDRTGQVTPAGHDPWAIEAGSRERLQVARRTGRDIALGAGVGAAWLGSLALFASNFTMCGVANTTSAAVGATGVVAIPVIALGSGVRSLVARGAVAKEFHHRRLIFPATIAVGGTRTGSLFFPVTPGPAQLQLRLRDASGAPQELLIDLGPLAGLHLKPLSHPGERKVDK